jgi:hypothetical protein
MRGEEMNLFIYAMLSWGIVLLWKMSTGATWTESLVAGVLTAVLCVVCELIDIRETLQKK